MTYKPQYYSEGIRCEYAFPDTGYQCSKLAGHGGEHAWWKQKSDAERLPTKMIDVDRNRLNALLIAAEQILEGDDANADARQHEAFIALRKAIYAMRDTLQASVTRKPKDGRSYKFRKE